MSKLKWINAETQTPNNSKYRSVMCTDGINIARYEKDLDTWIDRYGFHKIPVTHWKMNGI